MKDADAKKLLLVILGALIGTLAYAYWRLDLPGTRDAAMPERPSTNVEMLRADEGVPVAAEEVKYFGDRSGYYAHPAAQGSYPGVVMIHEWWGLNDQIKETARQLAGQGYAVLAVDLYGKVAATPDEARALTGALDQPTAVENMAAAADFLRARGSTKMASLGWCFGGGQSLQFALSGEPLDATVIYYGQLVTDPDVLGEIAWPVMGVFGEADQAVKSETAHAFDAALDAAGVRNEVYFYPGVGHAFANPSGANYAPAETKDAWAKTLDFLKRNLK
ncbi:MAG TPA: dienelactone hydrolase family protein [Patescibacteria group bacterium]|nr:dienelactone hydrolase family protein [Patescibacteria group bacterium]